MITNTTNEDCLFLDVQTPSHSTTESKLPVWFFIQGGGFADNTDANFNGTEVIVQSGFNIVVVQLNYRVGAFGFLASEKIRENGDLNVGLLDQRKALEWAQQYIHLVSRPVPPTKHDTLTVHL
jgi:acetylcholinesterase